MFDTSGCRINEIYIYFEVYSNGSFIDGIIGDIQGRIIKFPEWTYQNLFLSYSCAAIHTFLYFRHSSVWSHVFEHQKHKKIVSFYCNLNFWEKLKVTRRQIRRIEWMVQFSNLFVKSAISRFFLAIPSENKNQRK